MTSLEAALETMLCHDKDNADLQASACASLCELARHGKMSSQSYIRAIGDICKAMMRFLKHAELQYAAFTFITVEQLFYKSSASIAAERVLRSTVGTSVVPGSFFGTQDGTEDRVQTLRIHGYGWAHVYVYVCMPLHFISVHVKLPFWFEYVLLPSININQNIHQNTQFLHMLTWLYTITE
jgi:hypothetical protein